jgi:hypothetical protein
MILNKKIVEKEADNCKYQKLNMSRSKKDTTVVGEVNDKHLELLNDELRK